MVDLVDIEKIFNSQTINLTIATDTIQGTQILRSSDVNPPTRFNTRGLPIDSFATKLEEYTITASVTKALRDVIVTATTLNTRFVPPVYACILTGLSVGGTDDLSVAFNARFYNFSSDAPQNGIYQVTFTMRVKP